MNDSCKRRRMCSLLSSHGMWSVAGFFPMGEIGKFCVTLTEIPVHDMVFTEVLEINAHAHTV